MKGHPTMRAYRILRGCLRHGQAIATCANSAMAIAATIGLSIVVIDADPGCWVRECLVMKQVSHQSSAICCLDWLRTVKASIRLGICWGSVAEYSGSVNPHPVLMRGLLRAAHRAIGLLRAELSPRGILSATYRDGGLQDLRLSDLFEAGNHARVRVFI
jgi:hypothetical protein